MPTLQERLESATAQVEGDAGKLHDIVHGDATTTVATDNGDVDSVAKSIADLEAEYDANNTLSQTQDARDAAQLAQGAAETARDEAQAAADGTVLLDGSRAMAADLDLGGHALANVDAPATRQALGVQIGTDVLAPGGDGSGLTGIAYDMAFLAGYDVAMTAVDVEVQSYAKLIAARAGKFTGEVATIATAPTGQALVLDVEKNGVSIYSAKPQFADGATALTNGTLKSDGTEIFAAGDSITFKVTQVGSTAAGQGVTFTAKAELT